MLGKLQRLGRVVRHAYSSTNSIFALSLIQFSENSKTTFAPVSSESVSSAAFRGRVPKQNPLSETQVRRFCDPNIYGNKSKFPYINYLPFTEPSQEFISFATDVLPVFRQKHESIESVRNEFRTAFAPPPLVHAGTTVEKCVINNDGIEVEYYSVIYPGSGKSQTNTNTNTNDIILDVHGGCYCYGTAAQHFQYAETLSKLTGCEVIVPEYKLAPENPLPYAVNEVLSVYEHILETQQQTQSAQSGSSSSRRSRVAMSGGSAGGGMVLLTLQELVRRRTREQSKHSAANRYRSMADPACVVLNSPMTNLGTDTKSFETHGDLFMGVPLYCDTVQWAVGNSDSAMNVIGHNDPKNELYSPLFGSFEGITSAMYFTVGVSEFLLDDTLECARIAYESGIDVRCDLSPYMCHIWPELGTSLPEALVANAQAADWILDKFQR